MHIQRLSLSNFRRFAELELELEVDLTVLVARNGCGKTSVLDGIAVALGPFVGAFDRGTSVGFLRTDARLRRTEAQPEGVPQYPVSVAATFGSPDLDVQRELGGPKARTTVRGATSLVDLGRTLQEGVRAGDPGEPDKPVELPVVAYYGAGRLWRVHRDMTRREVLSADRTIGYEDALSSASNFAQFQRWLELATLAQLQEGERGVLGAVSYTDRLQAVRDAVGVALETEGWRDLHYSFALEVPAMVHRDLGTLPVSQLSDGARAMVSLVADLAFRCVRLNGHLGALAPRETAGIVLIDEVDLHLHPAWQQTVVGALQRAFPRVQFVLTTHSPQVLSTVDARSIRVLSIDASGAADEPTTLVGRVSVQTRGGLSSDVLAEVMGTFPIPDIEPTRWADDFARHVERGTGESDEAQALIQKVLAHFGAEHPAVQRLRRLERAESLKRRLAQ
ncbi:MAG: AAA family ATPase [Planctomycetota bacterium]